MEGKVIQQSQILEFGNVEETIMKKGFLEIKLPTSNWNCGFSPQGTGEVTPPESSNFPLPPFSFFSLSLSHSPNWWGEFWCNQNTSWFESNKKKVQKGDMVLRTKGNWLNVKSSVTAELGVYIVDFVMVTIPGDKRSGASLLAGEPIRHGSVSPWKPSSWIWPGWCPAVKHVTWLTATGFSSFYDKRKTDDNEEEDLFLFVNIYSFIYFIWGRLLSVIGQAQR